MSFDLLAKIEQLNKIGIALSAQRDTTELLEKILCSAKELTHAEGGLLYLTTQQDSLSFNVIQNDSLNIKLGGTQKEKISFSAIPIKLKNGEQNLSSVVAFAANCGKTVNIKDIYTSQKFDFKAVMAFDKSTNYRTQSMLTIPLKGIDGECLGVLQLINAKEKGKVIPFSTEAESLARSLASQASIALSNKKLVDEHKILFESFSKLIADTIDKKSPHTGAHCQRVPIITMMLAKKAAAMETGIFANFTFSENDFFELETAAWLHDCGKLTTPEHIMDKATKLQTVFDRIALIETRLNLKAYEEVVKRNNIPEESVTECRETYQAAYKRLQQINMGGESLSDEDANYIKVLGSQSYVDLNGQTAPLLSEDEIDNLSIQRGTLNEAERTKIQEHALVSINMLNQLPFPKELQRVSEYAGGHHEQMDGKGYPNGLTREELSIPARMMGIADIFEALSSGDRPYKDAKTLSESLKILGHLKEEGHIDPDLFNLFIEEKIYLDYAEQYLKEYQLDEIIHANIPGYEGK